jgi:hypothetical protein
MRYAHLSPSATTTYVAELDIGSEKRSWSQNGPTSASAQGVPN